MQTFSVPLVTQSSSAPHVVAPLHWARHLSSTHAFDEQSPLAKHVAPLGLPVGGTDASGTAPGLASGVSTVPGEASGAASETPASPGAPSSLGTWPAWRNALATRS